jgi:hypothetical protein
MRPYTIEKFGEFGDEDAVRDSYSDKAVDHVAMYRAGLCGDRVADVELAVASAPSQAWHRVGARWPTKAS